MVASTPAYAMNAAPVVSLTAPIASDPCFVVRDLAVSKHGYRGVSLNANVRLTRGSSRIPLGSYDHRALRCIWQSFC
jgi:hypothetical protein